MKKILVITAFTPAKATAGQNFTRQLLVDLSRENRVDLFYFKYCGTTYLPVNGNITIVGEGELTGIHRIVRAMCFPFFHPLFTSRFSLPILFQLQHLIRKNQYDVIYYDFSQVFLYSLFIRPVCKVFLMCHDVIYQKSLRDGWFIEKWWVYITEKLIFRNKENYLLTFSTKDVGLLKTTYGRDAAVVHFYLPGEVENPSLDIAPERNHFCFFGAWNRPENSEGLEWFLKEVYPQLNTDCRFSIMGGNLPISISDLICDKKNISYLGFVDNPYSVIGRCSGLVAPLFKGAGVKVKVIESLACGTPVIGTEIAFEGIPGNFKEGFIKVTDAHSFIVALNTFEVNNQVRKNLRIWFKENYKENIIPFFN